MKTKKRGMISNGSKLIADSWKVQTDTYQEERPFPILRIVDKRETFIDVPPESKYEQQDHQVPAAQKKRVNPLRNGKISPRKFIQVLPA